MRRKLIACVISTLATLASCCAAHGQVVCGGGYCPLPPGRAAGVAPAPLPMGAVAVYAAPVPPRVAAPRRDDAAWWWWLDRCRARYSVGASWPPPRVVFGLWVEYP